MKRLNFIGVFLITVLVLTLTVLASDPVVFTLNTPDAVTSYVSSKRFLNSSFEDGFLKLATDGADPSFSHSFSSDTFDAADYPFIKCRFKSDFSTIQSEKKQGQIFFKTNSSPAMGSSGSGTYTYFSLEGKNEWETVIVDLSKITNSAWRGKLELLRIDPISVASETDVFVTYVDYIGFFATEAEAKAYNSAHEKEFESQKAELFKHEPIEAVIEKDTQKIIITKESGISAVTPEENYVMRDADLSKGDTISLKDAAGNEKIIALSYNTGKKYVYVAQGEGAYSPSRYDKKFNDISAHWADEYIKFVSARKLFAGTSETEFSPDMTMTRGMFITVLGRMHGVDAAKYQGFSYNDVNINEYYAPYIKWASDLKIANPISTTSFSPEEPITRVAMADIISAYVKMYGYKLASIGKMYQFVDLDKIDLHSHGSIAMMQRVGIINGRTATTFEPFGIMTRAEVATVVSRLVKAILDVNPIPEGKNMNLTEEDKVIFKFDSVEAIQGWSYYGEYKADPTTNLPPIITENDVPFIRLENLNYMVANVSTNFDTAKFPIMQIKYRQNVAPTDSQYSYIYTDYFRTNKNGYEHQNSSALIRFGKSLKGDNQWQTLNLDISNVDAIKKVIGNEPSNAVQGIFEGLRFDWRTYAEGEYIDIEYVAFFKNEQDAKAFKGYGDPAWNAAGSNTIVELDINSLESYIPYTKNKLLIGGYDVAINSEEDVKIIAEAGLNSVFTRYSSVYHRNNILKWCYQYNIDVIFFNRGLMAPYEPKLNAIINGIENAPNFIGSSIADEPGATDFPHLAEISSAYKGYIPNKYAYINLFPNYASARQLEGYPLGTTDAQKAAYNSSNPAKMTFIQHLRQFVSEVKGTEILSADIYPFVWSGSSKVTKSGYVQGLDDMGTVSRENGLTMAVITQAVNFSPSVRMPSEEDARFQAYASLAFGTKMMFYYTYLSRTNEDGIGMIDREGNPSQTYYNTQPVNFEMQLISEAFMPYKNLGAFTVNVTAASHPYLNFTNQYADSSVKPEIKCDQPMLIGCFEKGSGKDKAYVLVNGTDLQLNKSISAKVKFLSATTVTAYIFGTPTVLTPDSDGYYNFDFASGQGIFVTIK